MNPFEFKRKRRKRLGSVLALLVVLLVGLYANATREPQYTEDSTVNLPASVNSPAAETLQKLAIKGRAPKTNYSRSQFSDGWANTATCNIRNEILQRDLESETFEPDNCTVLTGTLLDPYTNTVIQFTRGKTTSDDVQIDHVVAVSDAWQKGAQLLSYDRRFKFYNDPLNLLAVDGPTNNKKGDSDAASWLPPNKAYHCEYVARQVAVKARYDLWVTRSEYEAMNKVLNTCPEQKLPTS